MATHVLVIGATGPAGIEFCFRALSNGHRLTLYIRNPSKLPTEIVMNEAATIIEGTLEDIAKIQKAIASGPTIFVSFAGPVVNSRGTPITNAMKQIIPLLITHKFERAMVLATPSFPAPQDRFALKWTASIFLIKIIGGSAFTEFNGLGEVMTSYSHEELKWTLFRVPFLRNGPEALVNASFMGSGYDGMFLSRKSLAAWVMNEMNDGSEWIGKAPVLSN